MRVGTKLTVVTVVVVVIVLGIHGYQRVQNELVALSVDTERDHRTLAHGLSLAAQAVANRAGIAAAVELLEDASERENRIQISWSAKGAGAQSQHAASAGIEHIASADEEWWVSRVPLRLRETDGVLEMRESMAQQRSYIAGAAFRSVLVTAEVALLCICVLVGSAFIFVSRPMRLLLAKLERVGRGDLSGPLLVLQRDEMGELARAIDAMCEQMRLARTQLESETQQRIAAVEQMRHADRLRIVGQLASGVAHELGTPLSVVLAHARSMRSHAHRPTVAADAGVIVEQAERMTDIIRQLLDLARRHTPYKQPEDVRSIVARTFSVMAAVAAKLGVALHVDEVPGPIMAEVDAAQIQRVLANLVMNAIQSQPSGGQVRVRTTDANGAASEVKIRVEDDGSGISSHALERIFEPFFTTKDPGEGTGLGLTVSYGIVNDHGGRIEVESREGRGSAFTVCLPAQAS